MSSKSKKRMVLPTRPEPPTVEKIVQDVKEAKPSDLVFTSAVEPQEGLVCKPELEQQYLRSSTYLSMNKQLELTCELLKKKGEELKAVGEKLDQEIAEIREKIF
ncbi:UPF0449 protein C19orf25 homolog [Ornithorhynchus anatinus]|uniref:UPF0449 protein C19orf25 homolog n=1 Tax=Ornithorhynchus anatinus TaxID=9258 RepID=UPI000155BD1C|nr:UPF0449 protein C19orf25 homolog [Ornithorhynchus anatinus]XP_003430155.1 UPF0449 protein C19orf25 homolog [Ornithorhynchus anatinus]